MPPAELVMADLVDALIRERLCGFGEGMPEDGWYRVGPLRLPVHGGDGLQPFRYAGGPVRLGGRELAPDELLRYVAADQPHVEEVAAGLRTAVEHAAAVLGARHDGAPGDLLAGERLAATRNRPFHPTARAVVGWTAAELTEYGPMRREPLALRWVAVPAERLRFGGGAASRRIARLLLDDAEHDRLADGLGAGQYLLPVHPWQFEHVLPREFAAELDAGLIRPLAPSAGTFRPTASLRTLATADATRHVKLPLGLSTLGCARLLPPRYLDNGERGERTLRAVLAADPALAGQVAVCDETTWCGWAGDEFTDRPGHLAAQVRSYPADLLGTPALPMAALAAHEWHTLGALLRTGPVEFFRELAGAFTGMALGFLRHGVLPELHGQNVVVALRDGVPWRFVLRDHDTVRIHPQWMAEAGVPDPVYRVRPGTAQSLRLDTAEELTGYLQTLGFQVNLHGIADALARHYGIPAKVLWRELRDAVAGWLDRLDLPEQVERQLLHAPTWPSREVLGPLLRRGGPASPSMPARTGRVPNPLLT